MLFIFVNLLPYVMVTSPIWPNYIFNNSLTSYFTSAKIVADLTGVLGSYIVTSLNLPSNFPYNFMGGVLSGFLSDFLEKILLLLLGF